MCPPALPAAMAAMSSLSASTMFAVSLGVSAITAGAQYIAQSQQADAQFEAQQDNLNATAAAANSDMVQQNADLHAREEQERVATALRLQGAKTDAAAARSTAAATSGSAGLSYAALMNDYEQQYTSYADAEMMQLGFNMDQVQRTREGISANAQSRINTVPRTPIQRPSLLTTAAQIGSSAIGAYDNYSVRDPLTGNRTLT